MKPALRSTGISIVLAALAGLAFLVGFVVSEREAFPTQQVRHVLQRVEDRLGLRKKQAEIVTPSSVSTVFLRLRLDEIRVPIVAKGSGGGLTSAGEELLLLDHVGQIWSVGATSVRPTKIVTPSNGLEDLKAAATSEKYRQLEHDPSRLRYNDILFYREGDHAALVISYTEWRQQEECYNTTIARLPLPADVSSIAELEARSEAWQIVYRTQPCLPLKSIARALEGHMAGGRIAYLGGDRIVLGSGDYHWDGVYAPEALAQDDRADYGKMLEIDLIGRTARTLSKGNRNVQGVTTDRKGRIWAVEHGPRGGDELNRIDEGSNYGWPEVTLGTRYNELPWPTSGPYGRHDGFVSPIYAWVPSVATSGIAVIENFDPSWDGDLLVSTLKERTLFRLRLQDDRVVFAEPIPIGQTIRYVHMHTDGRIVLWTDFHRLIFITRDTMTPTSLLIDRFVFNLDIDDARRERLRTAIEACSECHSFDPTDNAGTPSLGGVYGRDIASTTYGNYSPALSNAGGRWSDEALATYLADPQGFAPGTVMPRPELSAETISDLTRVLEALAVPR